MTSQDNVDVALAGQEWTAPRTSTNAATPASARGGLRSATIWTALPSATVKLDTSNLRQTGYVLVDIDTESLDSSLMTG